MRSWLWIEKTRRLMRFPARSGEAPRACECEIDALMTESGDDLLTESGDPLLTEE